jgi:hypothetical protein
LEYAALGWGRVTEGVYDLAARGFCGMEMVRSSRRELELGEQLDHRCWRQGLVGNGMDGGGWKLLLHVAALYFCVESIIRIYISYYFFAIYGVL